MFEGQSEAAIREHEAGLTLIRDTFRDVPKAIDIDEGYPDQLWVKDSRFLEYQRAGRDDQPGEKPVNGDRIRERSTEQRTDLRQTARERQDGCRKRRSLRGEELQLTG